MGEVIDFKTRRRLAASDNPPPAAPPVVMPDGGRMMVSPQFATARSVLSEAWEQVFRGRWASVAVTGYDKEGRVVPPPAPEPPNHAA